MADATRRTVRLRAARTRRARRRALGLAAMLLAGAGLWLGLLAAV
jgi:hypothetical protein